MAYVSCCIIAYGRRSLTVKTDVLTVELWCRVLVISWRKKCAQPHSGERSPAHNWRRAPCGPVMLVTQDPAQASQRVRGRLSVDQSAPLGFLF
jgi:hypothetical protein